MGVDAENIIEMYVRAQAISEVPPELHKWSIISAMAACVTDRIWVRKSGTKLHANMYIMFIGPSGVGKGAAINAINHVIHDDNYFLQIGCQRMKGSAHGISDLLSLEDRKGRLKVPKPGEPRIGVLYLILAELSDSINEGPMAANFIRFITDLYETSGLTTIELNRTWGNKHLARPCLNILMGTTKEWLMTSLDQESVLSGFSARTICVQCEYDPNLRITNPVLPPDHKQLMGKVIERLKLLTTLDGEFVLSKEARELEHHWYQTRESPDVDDPAYASFRREHDMILKLATIITMANPGFNPQRKIVTRDAFACARDEIATVNDKLDQLLNYAATTRDGRNLDRCFNIIRQAGWEGISRPALAQHLKVTKIQLDSVLDSIHEWGTVDEFSTNEGTSMYRTTSATPPNRKKGK